MTPNACDPFNWVDQTSPRYLLGWISAPTLGMYGPYSPHKDKQKKPPIVKYCMLYLKINKKVYSWSLTISCALLALGNSAVHKKLSVVGNRIRGSAASS